MVYVDRFPEPVAHTAWARRYHETVGSSGAGKAFNAALLGIDVTMYALLGDDAAGAHAADALEAAGVTLVHDVDPAGTKRHLNLMDEAGERISIFLNAGSETMAGVADRVEPLIATSDVVAITIYNYTREALPVVARHGKPLWVDIHDWDGANPYHQDYIDAAHVVQMSSTELSDHRAIMTRLSQTGKEFVVCTHGGKGSTGLDADGDWIEVEAVPAADVVDSNGAGDAYFAGLLWARTQGSTWEAAMQAASRAAALAVASPELYHPEMSATLLDV